MQALHFVGPQLIHGLRHWYGSGCLVYVFWVYVYVEYGEQAHHYVHDDQPTGATSHPAIKAISPPVVSDEWSVQWMHWLSLPQLSTEVGRIGQAQCYREPEYDGRDHVCVLPVKYAVYIYQTLPRGGTIPNPPSVLPEETPTKHYRILCSRSETHWWFRFGLPTLTMSPIWLYTCRRRPLPIITTAD